MNTAEQKLLSPLCAPFFLKGGGHAILMIHGFTGSPAHMLKMAKSLNAQGFTVCGVRLTGHGTTIEDMLKASWRDWDKDVRQRLIELLSLYPHVSVCGLSMGGVLTLIMGEDYSDKLCACVSLAAPTDTKARFRHLAPLVGLFVPVAPKKNRSAASKMLDPEYDIGYHQTPYAKTHDLNVLMGRANRHLKNLTCPLLAVQSHKDQTISADSLDTICAGVSSKNLQKMWLDESPHVITITKETDLVLDKMVAFLRNAEKQQP